MKLSQFRSTFYILSLLIGLVPITPHSLDAKTNYSVAVGMNTQDAGSFIMSCLGAGLAAMGLYTVYSCLTYKTDEQVLENAHYHYKQIKNRYASMQSLIENHNERAIKRHIMSSYHSGYKFLKYHRQLISDIDALSEQQNTISKRIKKMQHELVDLERGENIHYCTYSIKQEIYNDLKDMHRRIGKLKPILHDIKITLELMPEYREEVRSEKEDNYQQEQLRLKRIAAYRPPVVIHHCPHNYDYAVCTYCC